MKKTLALTLFCRAAPLHAQEIDYICTTFWDPYTGENGTIEMANGRSILVSIQSLRPQTVVSFREFETSRVPPVADLARAVAEMPEAEAERCDSDILSTVEVGFVDGTSVYRETHCTDGAIWDLFDAQGDIVRNPPFVPPKSETSLTLDVVFDHPDQICDMAWTPG